ncbi:amidohydrolase family protein [Ilumatobacter sp.]|uniref:amidohydrolase family protein n=1 Tax=Ilumatobacter sp. TaxID=1967498 RepID=UPI0037515FFC
MATADIESGHFWERGFFNLLFRLLAPMLFSPERLERGLRQMVRYLHQNGVTAFNEPGAILVPGAWEMYQQILGDDDTPFFSYFLTDGRGPAEQLMPHDETLARAEKQFQMAPDGAPGTGKLAFYPKQVKLFADGAIISQLMQMKDPYLDREGNPNPHHHGEWILTPEMFEERTKLYWEAGFQIHIHVNGDLGLEVVLDTIERRMREHPRIDHRTVIVHFANSTEAQIDRIDKLRCVVSSNPYYPVGFADKFGEVGKIANFTIVDQNPLTVAPLDLDGIAVIGTVFQGRWFPVPAGVAGRASLATTRGPGALASITDPGGAGCICDVAREIMRAIADNAA